MPASPTDSTSSATRDRAPTVGAPAEVGPSADGTPDATTSVSPATGSGAKAKATDPACLTCRGPLERYAGVAEHKLGSFWCHACGVRHRLPAGAAATDGPAPESTTGTKAAG